MSLPSQPYVQRKKAAVSFPRTNDGSPLPGFLKRASLGGVECVFHDRGAQKRASGPYGFELATLVLTPGVQPAQFIDDTLVADAALTSPVVELYLVNLRPAVEDFTLTPGSWHVCEEQVAENLVLAAGKWGCPTLVLDAQNKIIPYRLQGWQVYGATPGGEPLGVNFDHYLVQMLLPNQSLCYYAAPAATAVAKIAAWQTYVDTQPQQKGLIAVNAGFEFFDDLQMWITMEASLPGEV
jgi:hypothetical protein